MTGTANTAASPPSLCRMENNIDKKSLWAKDLARPYTDEAAQTCAQTKQTQRIFGEFQYAAGTWDKQRRVVVKAEHMVKGENPRFIVTNLAGDSKHLYEAIYCARGEMENRIKEQQLGLFADRASPHISYPHRESMTEVLHDAC